LGTVCGVWGLGRGADSEPRWLAGRMWTCVSALA